MDKDPEAGQPSGTALVIDDEPHIRRAVRNVLASEFGEVFEAASGVEAMDAAAARRPDLVVLDLGLPDVPGLAVCREIRKWSSVPIIVLSAHHSEREKIDLLEAGADDYVTKPFSPAELLARVRVQLRRSRAAASPHGPGAVTIAGLRIDPGARTIERDGQPIHLTPTEWALLRTFIRNAGRVLTHSQLFDSVWARSGGDPQQYLRVYIAHLRRKIELDPVRPRLIMTEPGVGYRFCALE